MARLNYVHARYRANVAADLTGVFGDSTTPNLICVDIDGNGELVAADEGSAFGIIDCTEGKKDPTLANFNVAQAGQPYTVMVQAEITDADDLTPGQTLWAAASGDVATSAPATAQVIGKVVAKDNGVTAAYFNVWAV